MYTYNKLLLIGSCVSGQGLVREILKKYLSDIFIFYNNEYVIEHESLNNILKFLSTSPPKNKIFYSLTITPTKLLKYNCFDKNWKFIYFYRDILSTSAVGIDQKIVSIESYDPTKLFIMEEIFYQKYKHLCIKINYNDFFYNPIDNLEKIFKFLEIESLDHSILYNLFEYNREFVYSKNKKINLGNEGKELLNSKNIDILSHKSNITKKRIMLKFNEFNNIINDDKFKIEKLWNE